MQREAEKMRGLGGPITGPEPAYLSTGSGPRGGQDPQLVLIATWQDLSVITPS